MGVARPLREDPVGGWHHVWGRGIAKKPIFETRVEILRFQEALAAAVRRGDLEVHSFVFLTTHFHLLVRSPNGKLSEALGRILWDFTHRYNRDRDRDGTVWRSRFCSKPVESAHYRRVLVRYIDRNPVEAGLAGVPWKYEHGSAQHFVFESNTPDWLCRSWVDEQILRRTGRSSANGGRYQDAFPLASPELLRLVEFREAVSARGPDPLGDLVRSAPAKVRRWLEERSLLADGLRPGHALVDPGTLLDAVECLERRKPNWTVKLRRRPSPATRILRAALLRDLCGLTYVLAAERIGTSDTTVKRLVRDHATLVASNEEYANVAADLTLRVLNDTYD